MVGCGYCLYEKQCKIHDPKVNKARCGCPGFRHFDDAPVLTESFQKKEAAIKKFNDDLLSNTNLK